MPPLGRADVATAGRSTAVEIVLRRAVRATGADGRYSESPLGRLPTEIDYADYRDAGGARAPCRWLNGRPSGRFTVQIEQMQANVPLDDAKVVKPAAPKP